VGLDISKDELLAAPAGSYDEIVAANVAHFSPELEGRFDLAVSWQVLEHVKPLDLAFENLRQYLRPGGRLVAQFSGTFSVFGLLNKSLPRPASEWILRTFLGRSRESIFPAPYHRCWYNALRQIGASWTSFEITPLYLGAIYFPFSRSLQGAYIAYEEWAERQRHWNLAGYYRVVATR